MHAPRRGWHPHLERRRHARGGAVAGDTLSGMTAPGGQRASRSRLPAPLPHLGQVLAGPAHPAAVLLALRDEALAHPGRSLAQTRDTIDAVDREPEPVEVIQDA